jgi:hypothetical protein
MEVLIGLIIALIPCLMFPLMTGWCALSLNRKFWPWFFAGLFLPFLGVIILLCLPVKEKSRAQALLLPVSSEEIFEHCLDEKEIKRINGHDVQFSARA